VGRLTVFCWHNVHPTWCFPAPPGRGRVGLEAQLRALTRWAHVVPLEEGLDALRDGRPLPSRAVAVTFDDGYRDNLTDALPLLERLGVHATIFLVPDLLSRTVRPWWEVLGWAVFRARAPRVEFGGLHEVPADPGARRPLLERLLTAVKALDARAREEALDALVVALAPEGDAGTEAMFCDWDDAARLAAHPRVGIGSHSLRHVILANETPEAQHRDLATSRRILEERLGVPVRSVAYPVGDEAAYSGRTVEAARAAGYAYGLSTGQRRNGAGVHPHHVARWVMSPERGTSGFLTLVRPAERAVRKRLRALRPSRG